MKGGIILGNINVIGYHSFYAEDGKKLSNALEDNGIDILHRCGGKARCATCRVEVIEGDFGHLTEVEKKAFAAKGLDDTKTRLSCQVRVNGDAFVNPLMTKRISDLDPGPRPED